MEHRILITGAGGPAAVSCWRSLASLNALVFMADADHRAAGLYLVPGGQRAIVPLGTSEDFTPTLLSLCDRWKINLLIPTVDVELAKTARAHADFESLGVRLLTSSAESLEICADKYTLLSHAKDVIPTPPTWSVNGSLKTASLSFPMIAKPKRGSGSRGVVTVNSQDDIARLPMDDSYILQRFLPGAEYSVDVLSTPEGESLAAVPRERLKIDSGIAVTSRTVKDRELMDHGKRIVSHLRLSYVSNVQFRRDSDGTPRLLEINPRMPGTMPLTVASGINMPLLAVRMGLGLTHEPVPSDFSEIAMVRTWQDHPITVTELGEMRDQEGTIASAGMGASTEVT